MGLSPFKRCSTYGDSYEEAKKKKWRCSVQPTESAPNPAKFKIVRMKSVGSNLVAKINYPHCTNYEGNKICVFRNMTARELSKRVRIDPHFDKSSRAPFARFKPTKEGWNAAVKLASII